MLVCQSRKFRPNYTKYKYAILEAARLTSASQTKRQFRTKTLYLSWNVAEDTLKSGYVTYRDPSAKDGAGYFTVMLIPPKRITPEKVAPKEMVFVIDCSGSQSGAPLNKAKETMRYILDHMNANDTFQIIAFNSTQSQFADKPQPVSAEMKDQSPTLHRRPASQWWHLDGPSRRESLRYSS
jgi:hypothetical protein